MTTWSHVRAALWDDDPLRLGECAGRRYCASPGVHRLNLNPAARPYLARNAPTCSSRSSHSEARTTPLRTEAAIHAGNCTDAAFIISPMVPLVS